MSVSDSVPSDVRKFVVERDNHCCRICGQWVASAGLHHIRYRSAGGQDVPGNLIVLGWQPGHDCHLTIAHGAGAGLIRPHLVACTEQTGVTALQLMRWARTATGPASPGAPA